MLTLALDTALGACSAAVVDGDRVLAARAEPMTRGHQERLAPLVQEVMREAGFAFPDLARVGVTTGPGSFTGLRVGLAFARTLALALGRPCVGVSTLAALAAETRGEVVTAIPAPQDRLYTQRFRDAAAVDAPRLVAVDDLDLTGVARLVGPAAARLAGLAPTAEVDALAWPGPAALARLCAAAPEPQEPPAPLYLRAPDARTLAERGLPARG